MFVHDPLDVAPAAQRPTRTAWTLLLASVLFAALCAALLERSIAAVHTAQDSARAAQESQRARAKNDAIAREQANDPATREKLLAQQQLQRTLRMSWSNLFDALEQAARKVDGRVTITSLAPVKTQTDGAEVSVVGLALTSELLLDYIEALQQQPYVREAILTSQQAVQNNGMTVSRFQLSLVWEPAR